MVADCDDHARWSLPRMCLASTKTAAIGNTLSSRWNESGAEKEAWPRLDAESGVVWGPFCGGTSAAEDEVTEKGDEFEVSNDGVEAK